MNSWAEYTLPLLRQLTDLAEAGEVDSFAERFHREAATWLGRWDGNARLPSQPYPGVDPAVIEAIRRVLLERLPTAARRPELNGFSMVQLMTVYPLLTSGLDVSAEAHAILDDAEHRWSRIYDPDLAASLLLTRAPDEPLPPNLVATLRRDPPIREWFERAGLSGLPADPPLNPGEAWTDRVLEFLDSAPAVWHEFLAHLGTATGPTPSRRWSDRTLAHIEARGAEAVRDRLLSWLKLVGEPRTVFLHPREHYGTNYNDQFDPCNIGHLRGLVWTVGLLPPHGRATRVLARLVAVTQRKIPGVGVRSQAITNAAIHALSMIDTPDAVGQLARLAATATAKPTKRTLDTVLRRRAHELGIGRDEIEELAVPSYGLSGIGVDDGALGDATWRIRVEADGVKLLWRNASGKTVKSPPASVKRDHAAGVKELRARVKEIAAMATAQSERLDRQFLARRRWGLAEWRNRLCDHPLLGALARRLVWIVDGTACLPVDGDLRDAAGEPVRRPSPDAAVTLWHPIGRDPGEVLAWRDLLERHEITQPFKQAHRETYRLTAAERDTGVDCDRFADRILKQHRFNMLARTRGWDGGLLMSVDDDHDCVVKDLPAWGLRAEYWFTGAEGASDEVFTDSGAYLHVATGRLRFRFGDDTRPPRLAEVPPLVLSEILRDVDMFVAVAGVDDAPDDVPRPGPDRTEPA